jgi:hypothetical protein
VVKHQARGCEKKLFLSSFFFKLHVLSVIKPGILKLSIF